MFGTVGGLFEGVGGFGLAARNLGLEMPWSSEVEDYALEVLAKQFPETQHLGDVAGVNARSASPVSILTGGSPCQGFSVAGVGLGMDDPRSGLFGEMMRVRNELRPPWLVWENVPGVLTSSRGRDWANVLAALLRHPEPIPVPPLRGRRSRYHGWAVNVREGIEVAWRTLDAQYHGVPQRRRRVLVVAHEVDGPLRALDALFPDYEGGYPMPMEVDSDDIVVILLDDEKDRSFSHGGEEGWDPRSVQLATVLETEVDPKFFLSAKGASGIIRRATRKGKDIDPVLEVALNNAAGLETRDEVYQRAFTLLQERGGFPDRVGTLTTAFGPKNYSNTQEVSEGSVQAVPVGNHDPARALTRRHYKGINTTMDDGAVVAHPIDHFRKSRRAASDTDFETWVREEATNTLNTYENSDVRTTEVIVSLLQGLNLQPRRLTPTECEALQGFPKGWTEGLSQANRYKAMGNAIAVPVAEAVLRGIVEQEVILAGRAARATAN